MTATVEPHGVLLSVAGSERVLRAERLRNARRSSAMRVAIVGAFLVNMLFMVFVLKAWPFSMGTVIFALYFALAVALWRAVHRSERAALLSSPTIPILDLPIVFALQVSMLPQRTGIEAQSSVLWLLSVYLLLVLFSALSLSRRIVIASAAIALGLELIYGRLASSPGSSWYPQIVILIAAFTATTLYAMHRLRALIESTAQEQARIRRLRRYFSPQVAAVLEREGGEEAAGTTRTITVLFGDIRSFTRLTRDMPSDRVRLTEQEESRTWASRGRAP